MLPTYFAIKNKETGLLVGGPSGTSSAPHLYHTRGKASAAMKTRWATRYGHRADQYEVVEIQLTEMKGA